MISYALASVSAEHLELLEALILNYGHYKIDEEVYTKIMSYLEALHSKWENSYVEYQKLNITGDGDLSYFHAYCELERYLGRAYLAVSESYDWLKAHIADTTCDASEK